jgi:hypothetical protein
MQKIKVESIVKVRPYPVIMAAIEAGGEYGLNRAFKHTDEPTPDGIKEAIVMAIQNEICETLDFGDVE